MRISDWSSDVCSSDLRDLRQAEAGQAFDILQSQHHIDDKMRLDECNDHFHASLHFLRRPVSGKPAPDRRHSPLPVDGRSEEHTSELQSLMRISYAVFCLKKKNQQKTDNQ